MSSQTVHATMRAIPSSVGIWLADEKPLVPMIHPCTSGLSQFWLIRSSRAVRARATFVRMDSAVAVHTYGLGSALPASM